MSSISILDLLGGGAPEGSRLRERWLGQQPAFVMLVTDQVEQVALHYEKDPVAKGYAVCPGPRCPYCAFGAKPQRFLLLPVFDIESGTVMVLRISTTHGPLSLLDQLVPFIQRAIHADVSVSIRKQDEGYSVTEVPLAEHADRGTDAMQAFKMARDAGLTLASAFRQPTVEEIAEIPRMRRLFESLDLEAAAKKAASLRAVPPASPAKPPQPPPNPGAS